MRPYWFRTVGAAISRPKAFPFGGRCPRRGRMRCAAKGRLRAGQCPAPTERPESSPYFVGAGVLTRPPSVDHNARRARPPGCAAHAIPQGRGVPLPRAGPRPARKPSPCKGEGAERSEADEGDFLKFAAASGSPKGLPCQVRESSLRTAGEGRTPEKTPSAVDQFPPRRGFQRIKIIRTAVKSHTRRSCCVARGEFFYFIIGCAEMLPAFSTKSGDNSRGSLCP